ncbi:MAG: tetratricopeptide repeat-containing sulfotransferase family protein [Sphingomicrobium sp.]
MLEEAMSAYREGNFNQAEVQCRQILEREPDHLASMQVLAAVAGRFGVPRRGIELVKRIIELQPLHADAHIQLAKLLRQDAKDEEAIEALKAALEFAPDSAAAYNDLGLIYLDTNKEAEAAECFDHAVELDPAMAIAHFNKALALEARGMRSEAIAAFRNVVAVDANFAEAYAKLGNLLLQNNDHAAAFDMFRRAVEAKPESATAWLCQAKILAEEGKAAAAEETVRKAIELQPQNGDAHAWLGSILMELGRFEDAAAASDLAIALNRRQLSGYHQLVNARKLAERDRPLIAQMEWLLKEGGLPEHGRIDLGFALGKAYDDYGEYVNAIGYFDEANRLKHKQTSADTAVYANFSARVDWQIANFNADYFSRNAAVGADWEAPILIVGMPRSGTTLVEQILSSHPSIGAGGELAFWRDHLSGFRMDKGRRVDPAWVQSTAREYQALLEELCPGALRITDKMPQNFNFIALIRVVFPRARIIHCMRNPIDTCLSIYFQNFARNVDFAYHRRDLVSFYRQYQRLMTHWRSVLPSDSLFEVQYEQLVQDPEPLTRKLIDFCGLQWDDACLHHERNLRPVRTASLWQARQPVYRTSVARWQNYRPWLGELEEFLSDGERYAAPPHETHQDPAPCNEGDEST